MKTLLLTVFISVFAVAAPLPEPEENPPVFTVPPDAMTPEARPLPKGSYINSCDECRLEDDMLECQCEDSKGTRWGGWSTKLDLRNCKNPSDIANWNGQLMCMTNNPEDPLPEGSYLRTCHECRIDDRNLLSCLCRTRNGQWQPSSISLDYCPEAYQLISNCNGELSCNPSGC